MGAINDAHVKAACRPGAGADTCRYLTMGPDGWNCAKTDEGVKRQLDARVARGLMTSRGDNCEGR